MIRAAMKSPFTSVVKSTMARSFSAAPVSDFGKVRVIDE